MKATLRKYMDLEGDARKAKERAEKELRDTQIRLAGLEEVDVKQLKNQVKTLQRQVCNTINADTILMPIPC